MRSDTDDTLLYMYSHRGSNYDARTKLPQTHKIKQTSITPPSLNTQGDSHDCRLIQAEVEFPAT